MQTSIVTILSSSLFMEGCPDQSNTDYELMYQKIFVHLQMETEA